MYVAIPEEKRRQGGGGDRLKEKGGREQAMLCLCRNEVRVRLHQVPLGTAN